MMTNEVLELVGTQGIGVSRILAGEPDKASHFANIVCSYGGLFVSFCVIFSHESDLKTKELDILLCSPDGNSNPGGLGSPNKTDRKRLRHPYQSKTFKVEINFSAKILILAIVNALHGQESENSQEALRVLDIILRQHAAKQNNGNSSLGGHESPNETKRKRLCRPY
ncbi:hypothetical protein BC332_01075 [Capsicum chinense]|nr:hypothetical protein BC332_01075 [Capsicum chinense]